MSKPDAATDAPFTATARRSIRIEWGDCDPANIVFYPRYFAWFDSCTAHMFEDAGMPPWALFKRFGVVGMPLVDARARFILPSRFGDELIAESGVAEWRRSSFVVRHRFLKGEALALEGFETRVWAGPHPDDPDRIKGYDIPKEVIEKLSR